MALYLNEMQNFIKIASISNPLMENEEDEIVVETVKVTQISNTTSSVKLLEDIKDAVFKMQSFRESSSDQKYALGFEQGLALAADMITKVIEHCTSEQENI